MPTVSEFYGVVITMNYSEHGPAHFHVRYGEHRALFEIDPIRLLRGRLPTRAQRMVQEWARLHQRELIANWQAAQSQRPLSRIAPLD